MQEMTHRNTRELDVFYTEFEWFFLYTYFFIQIITVELFDARTTDRKKNVFILNIFILKKIT